MRTEGSNHVHYQKRIPVHQASAGRNIIIGIICLVIAVSACIGLSIRQAAESAKTSTLEGMSITASISYDRNSAMQQMGGMMGGFPGGNMGGMPSDLPDNMGGGKNPFDQMFDGAANYVTEVDSAMDLTVVFQMIGVGLLLTLVASAASVLFIMRYDPLKILANRD